MKPKVVADQVTSKSIIRLYCIPPEYIMKEIMLDELEKT